MIPTIKIDKGSLIPVSYSDSVFIHELFEDEAVQTYFVLRDDHSENLDTFIQYMINNLDNQKSAFYYIIYNEFEHRVGLIIAELMHDPEGGLMWSIAYAVVPQFRNRGYATSALKGLTFHVLNNTNARRSELDISLSNKFSESVAVKCGYSKPTTDGKKIAYIDFEHLDINHLEQATRFKWYIADSEVCGERALLFKQSSSAFRSQNYELAIKLYNEALNHPYVTGTNCTDAQIFSNMGMALSSSGYYFDAFKCLKKAQELGLNNSTIMNELRWLRDNVGLY